jgi:hypothetical protein
MAIIEFILIHSFVKFAFNIGIPIMKRTFEIPSSDFIRKIDFTYKESEGKFRFSADHKVYFLSQIFLFRFFRFTTPFPFKAVGTINNNNSIDIIDRLPIGSCLFLLFWIIAWIVAAITSVIQSGELNAVGIGLVGLISAGIMIGISYPIEKKRMETMIYELKKIISAKPGGI